MAEYTPHDLSEERLREAAEEFVRQGVDIRARVHDLTLAALQSRRFDLVLLDWVLPSTSGVALVKWMRQRPEYESVPVIMVTTKDQPEDVLTAVESGVTEYVLKPIDREVLTRKITKVLSVRNLDVA